MWNSSLEPVLSEAIPEFIGQKLVTLGSDWQNFANCSSLHVSTWSFPVIDHGLTLFSRYHDKDELRKFAWQSRDAEDSALYVGWGAIVDARWTTEKMTKQHLAIADSSLPYFFLLPFPDKTQEATTCLKSSQQPRLIIPEILWTLNCNGTQISVISEASGSDAFLVRQQHESLLRVAMQRLQSNHLTESLLPKPTVFHETPNRENWREMVKRALSYIEAKHIEKVVLGRRKRLKFSESLATSSLVEHFFAKRDACYLFAIQDSEKLLLGRSPERLLRWQGNSLALDTIAGTRPRLKDRIADRIMGNDLLYAEKDRQEHELVVSEVSERLNVICQNYTRTKTRQLLSLNYVHHLYSAFSGQMKSGVSAFDALQSLLPTAAVGGYPRAKSIAYINENEPEPRGYFCGAVGFGLGDCGEAAITIRTGIVRGNELELFAGAGIVQGSEPESEWEETEQKMWPFLSLFTQLEDRKSDIRLSGRIAEVTP